MLPPDYRLRLMKEGDYSALSDLCARVYPEETPYTAAELEAHHRLFPEGQFVAEHLPTGAAVGAHYTLILRLEDFHPEDSWDILTARGTFSDHNPTTGHTLYGADIMVDPQHQHHGLASALTKATQDLVVQRALWRMVGASRLPGYGKVSGQVSADEYVREVVAGVRVDPVLTVHLKDGWQVVRTIAGYLQHDVESANEAAIIQWVNLAVGVGASPRT
jgi:GNAT superfamily N-acetyltransferase